jgi:hypothetical protein
MRNSSNKGKNISLYIQALNEAEKKDFETADNVDGIDDEINLMRIKIKFMLMKEPENVRLIMHAANIVAKMIKERYAMDKGQSKGLTSIVRSLVKDVGLASGAEIVSKKLRND